jgi:hypothetical protein
VNGFTLASFSQGILLTNCVADNNFGSLQSIGFSISGTGHCLTKCIANLNQSAGSPINIIGFFCTNTSFAVTIQACLTKENINPVFGSSGLGFKDAGTNNALFANIGFYFNGNNSFSSDVPNLVTYDTFLGRFDLTPNAFDNIECI